MKYYYKFLIFLFLLLVSLSFVSAVNDTLSTEDSSTTVRNDINSINEKSIQKDYSNSSKSISSNSTVKNVKIEASNVKAYSGENYTFKGSVIDKNNQPVKNGKLVIKFNGKTHITTQVNNGTFNFKYTLPTNYAAKDYKLQYVYVGNANYGRYELNKTLTLMKRNSNLVNVTVVAGRIETRAGDKIYFNGLVYDKNKNPVSGGNVVIKLNGKTHVITKVTDGHFEHYYVMPNYVPKDYNLQYVYVANNKYARYELNTTLKLFDKNSQSTRVIASDVVSYKNGIVTLKGKVVDSNNNPITHGNILIRINNRTEFIMELDNGTFQTKLEVNYSPKNYLLTYVYGYHDGALRSETNRLLKVLNKVDPTKTNVIVNGEDISTVLGTTIKVNGTVMDVNGNFVPNGTVQLRVKETSEIIGTFDVRRKGKFSGEITVPSGNPQNYTIQYVYVQNNYYNRYELNKSLTLVKQNTSLIFYDYSGFDPIEEDYPIQIAYDNLNHIEYCRVKVLGATDGRIAETGKLGIKINGKTLCDEKGNPYILKVRKSQEFPDDPLWFYFRLPSYVKGGIEYIVFCKIIYLYF